MKISLQFGRFLVGGLPATVVFYGSFLSLTRTGGMAYEWATMVALLLSAGLNFVLQKFWAFQEKKIRTIPRQSLQFLGLAVGYFIASVWLVVVFVEQLHFRDWTALLAVRTILASASFLITRKIFTN